VVAASVRLKTNASKLVPQWLITNTLLPARRSGRRGRVAP
jgi:hypothetical protein